MKIGKVGARIAMGTEAGKMVVGVLMLAHWVLTWFVVSVVVLLRKQHGERALSWINILFGLFAVSLFTGFGNAFLSGGSAHMSKAIEFAYYLVVGASIYHRVVIWRRNKRGELWHSYSPGQSLIRIPGISAEVMAKWIEPGLVFALGILAGKFHDAPLRLWLLISGCGLLVHEQVSYFLQRQAVLDMQDAMIEQKNWSEVMSGKPAKQTQGYTIAKSNLDIINRNPEIRDAFESLPEDIKGILDKEAA